MCTGTLRVPFWQATFRVLKLFAAEGLAVQQCRGARCTYQDKAVEASLLLLASAMSFSTS